MSDRVPYDIEPGRVPIEQYGRAVLEAQRAYDQLVAALGGSGAPHT